MNLPWWHGLPPAETTIRCAAGLHRLRWAAGELRAADHDDVPASQATAEPGRPQSPCLEVLSAWSRHAADLEVLVLGSRGPGDDLPARLDASTRAPLTPPPEGGGPGRGGPGGGGPAGPETAGRAMTARASSSDYTVPGPRTATGPERDLITLLSLGPAVQARLVATAAAAWARQLRSPGDRTRRAGPALHAALYGRVTAALRAWTGRPDLDIDLTMIGEQDRPGVAGHGDRVEVRLPFAWMAGVWARGLTITGGRFCLTAAPSGPGNWLVSTVGRDLGKPREAIVALPPPDR